MKRLSLPIIPLDRTRKTPVAWLQLSHQKIRLLVAILGISFANILIFSQLGLKALLFDGITLVPENLNGDLYLISAYAQNIGRSSFPRIYLYQADGIPGVASASPLYIGKGEWVNPENLRSPSNQTEGSQKKSYEVRVLAFNPHQPVFMLPEINQQLDLLTIPNGLLFDRLAQPQLGSIAELFNKKEKVTTVMNNRSVRVVGLFSMGSTVMDEGHVIMSDWNYGQQNGNDKLEKISVGILTLESGVALEKVIATIQQNLPQDVKVLTKQELIQGEQDYIAQFPEGKILNFGAAIGFIVGVVVVYQVLYTDISEHLPEYATLKAMGYSDHSLLMIILQEAMILALMGFIPGFFTSYGVYHLLENTTKIPLEMRSDVTVQVFVLTITMCGISGAIASKKLRTADPADIFH